jgi:YD repeat-containing protein
LDTTPSDTQTDAGKKEQPVEIETGFYEQEAAPDADTVIEWNGVRLDIPALAVTEPTVIRIESLADVEQLDSGMQNITGRVKGFRFKPHGIQFEKDILVSIPFDTRGIQDESELAGLYTFFYNETDKRWEQLERVKIDLAQGLVTSKTNHFTDMINSVLKLPESPKPLAFNVNSIKDIKAVEPFVNIEQLKGLQPSNYGSAGFRIGMRIPTGRNGMTPDVGISYNSGQNNGWLGVGFDFTIPSITIDTKFGVPDYDDSDVYLLNGEELIMTGYLGSDARYQKRVEGDFMQIARKGNDPTDYWFEVTDKGGTKFIYGGTGATGGALGDFTKGIFTWYIQKIIDRNGNNIEYFYNTVTDGIGTHKYLHEIRYTGKEGVENGLYHIYFINEPRSDKIIDCRGRFVNTMGQRLSRIEAWYGSEHIRSVELVYMENDFGKSAITELRELDNADTVFYSYGFDYYQMPTKDDGFDLFPEVTSSDSGDDWYNFEQTNSFGGGTGVYVGVGPGYAYSGFNFSGGLTLGFQGDYSYQLTSLRDMNGDGIPDFVKHETAFSPFTYRPGSFDEEAKKLTFGSSVTAYGNFNRAFNDSRQLGFNVGASGGFGPLSGSVGGTFNWSSGLSKLIDFNGDGFTDFISDQNATGYYVGSEGGFTHQNFMVMADPPAEEIVANKIDDMADLESSFHLQDPVIKWAPPYTGEVRISGTITKTDDGDSTTESDGIKANIYQNNASVLTGMVHDPAWEDVILLSDGTPDYQELSESILLKNVGDNYTVNESVVIDQTTDCFYFKLSSIKSIEDDLVEWSPEIEYTSVNLLENLEQYDNGEDTEDIVYYPIGDTGHIVFKDGDRYYFELSTGSVLFDDGSTDAVDAVGEKSPAGYLAEVIDDGIGSVRHLIVGDTSGDLLDTASLLMYYVEDDVTTDVVPTVSLSEVYNSEFIAESKMMDLLSTIADDTEKQLIIDSYIHDTERNRYVRNRTLSGATITTLDAILQSVSYSSVRNVLEVVDEVTDSRQVSYRFINDVKEEIEASTFHEAISLIMAGDTTEDAAYLQTLYSHDTTDDPYVLDAPLTLADTVKVYWILADVGKWDEIDYGRYERFEKSFRFYSDQSLPVERVAYEAWMDEEIVVSEALDISSPDETSRVQLFQFNDNHELEPVYKYIHLFSFAGDFTLDSIPTPADVPVIDEIPESTFLEYLAMVENRVDLTDDTMGAIDDQLFLSEIYQGSGGTYFLKKTGAALDAVYYDGTDDITYRQMLSKIFYRLGYAEEYFTGGVYNWRYGIWNGDQKWDTSMIGVEDNRLQYTWFEQMDPYAIGAQVTMNYPDPDAGPETQVLSENKTGRDAWLGTPFRYDDQVVDPDGSIVGVERYFVPYIAGDGTICPSRKGGDTLDKLPKSFDPNSFANGKISLLQESFSYTGNFSGTIQPLSSSVSMSQTLSWFDMMDINGDRYPDFINHPIGENKPRAYLNRGNGVSGTMNLNNIFSNIRITDSYSLGFSLSLSPEMISGWQMVNIEADGNEKGYCYKAAKTSGGGDLNATLGTAKTTVDWTDINGDGLLDQIRHDGGSIQVKLNLGDGFVDANWSGGIPFQEPLYANGFGLNYTNSDVIRHVTSMSAGFGFSVGCQYGGGGGSVTLTGTKTKVDMMDINGDGLPDRVFKVHTEPFFRVQLNKGDHFAPETKWYAADWGNGFIYADDIIQKILSVATGDLGGVLSSIPGIDPNLPGIGLSVDFIGELNVLGVDDVLNFSKSVGVSINGSGTIPIPVGGPFPITLYVSPSGNFSATFGSVSIEFTDVNGDGLPDQILKMPYISDMYMRINGSDRVGLLKEITTPYGGTVNLEYEKSTNSVDMPNATWTLSKVTRTDGFVDGDSYAVEYDYYGGYYDRSERTFYGFDQVVTTNPDGTQQFTHYYNTDYGNKGVAYLVETLDSHGVLVSRGDSAYDFDVLASTGSKDVVFPTLLSETNTIYDEAGRSIVRVTEYTEYDAYGNVTEMIDLGDPGDIKDDIRVNVDYRYTDTVTDYEASNPEELRVRDYAYTVLRERYGRYDARGNMIELEERLESGVTGPITTIDYDGYGNIGTITYPKNNLSDLEAYSITYDYDDQVNTYIEAIVDSFGYTSSAFYDKKLGVELYSQDMNGRRIDREYDTFGRLTDVRTEYDNGTPAVKFLYFHDQFPARAVTKNKVEYDIEVDDDQTLETVIVADGLGRVIQTKKEGVIENASKTGTIHGMNISGVVVYDEMGRVIQQGQPLFQPMIDLDYYTEAVLENPTFTTYDDRGRVKTVTLPDGSVIRTDYAIEDGYFKTQVTDPENNRKVSYTDSSENIVRIDQINNGRPITTRYEYSLLNEITAIVDADGNRTEIEYDRLGRRRRIDNPDTGLLEYNYDNAGNLTEKIDPNLRAKGQSVRYEYTFNRLEKIDYPESEDVIYTYGDPDAQYNRIGRVESITSESGQTTFEYGILGEQTRVTKTLHSLNPMQPDESYTTEYRYDFLGRVKWLIYPDGEKVTYTYDEGGQITAVSGLHHGTTFNYIDEIRYDEFGQRSYIKYGNGTDTRYEYDEDRRWLSNIRSTRQGGASTFQNITYQFDAVGNIRQTTDVAGRNVIQNYTYDDLYQLKSVRGSYENYSDPHGTTNTYEQQFIYDDIGNMTQKISSNTILPYNTKPEHLNYNLQYTYSPTKPHQATKIGTKNYAYDDNGNVTRIYPEITTDPVIFENPDASSDETIGIIDNLITQTEEQVSESRESFFIWNEENRMMQSQVGEKTTRYLYDAGGERTVKNGELGETVYVDKFFQVQSDLERTVTKHIFVGATRIVSKLSHYNLGASDIEYARRNQYTYHGDHLGSTNYVTDYQGYEYEYYQYTPYGESWIEEESDALGPHQLEVHFKGT